MKYFILPATALLIFLFSCTKERDLPPKYGTVVPVGADIAFGSLRINEFWVHGTSTAVTNMFGASATAKWFEIYNPTANDINLNSGQWFLTDDLTSNQKYPVPTNSSGVTTLIPSKGFLLVFCPSSSKGTYGPATRINTSFSLSSSSGSIGIFYQKNSGAATIPVDSLNYNFGVNGPPTDISYGRFPDGDGSSSQKSLSSVTPEAANKD